MKKHKRSEKINKALQTMRTCSFLNINIGSGVQYNAPVEGVSQEELDRIVGDLRKEFEQHTDAKCQGIKEYFELKLAETLQKYNDASKDKQVEFEDYIKSEFNNVFERLDKISDEVDKHGFILAQLQSLVGNLPELFEKVKDIYNKQGKQKKDIDALQADFKSLKTALDYLVESVERVLNKLKELEARIKELEKQVEELNAKATKTEEDRNKINELYNELAALKAQKAAAADVEPKRRESNYAICPRCGSFDSFDTYVEGKNNKDGYYVCAICGCHDNVKKDKVSTITAENPTLSEKEQKLGLRVIKNIEDIYTIQNVGPVKRILYVGNGDICLPENEKHPINVKLNKLQAFSISIKEESDAKSYTLGNGLFKEEGPGPFELSIPKLYGMKYVKEIEDGCFIGISGEKNQDDFLKNNGFELGYEEKWFS